MNSLENALEWLRPFVDSKVWDFCVVWKLGNDPSRYIEFIGCCCGGGISGDVKDEKGVGSFCKDDYYKHPIRTKACEALSKLPCFMTLFSGNHGESVISAQPRWLRIPNAVGDISSSAQSYGTQVLIPVLGGLIELFSSKQIPKDEKIVEYIIAHHNLPLKKEETIANENYCKDSLIGRWQEPLLEEKLENFLPPLSSLIPQIQEHSFLTHVSIDRSSSGSNPSIEHPSLESHSILLPPRTEPKHKTGKSTCLRKSKNNDSFLKQQANSIKDSISKAGKGKVIPKSGKHYVSKNLVTERNRRKRIQEGLHTLRALVPNISKMDKVAILGDAIEYIGKLEMEVKALQGELNEIEEEENRKHNQVKASMLKPLEEEGRICPMQKNKDSPSPFTKENSEVQLELYQIGKSEFVIKVSCDQKQGGFSRLIHGIDALGFQVVDANITTFRGKVLNILKLEENKKDAQPKTLRESLIKLAEAE